MATLTTTDGQVPGLGERIRGREVAEAHFVAEVTNDPDQIMRSMKSYAPLLTSVVVGEHQLVRCATPAEQHAFYVASRGEAHMTKVELFTSIGGDWYGFVHGLSSGEALATGERYTAELVGLLPTTPDEDTIAGEIGLAWPQFGKAGDPPGELARERVETARTHDAWLDALRDGDAARLGGLYADTAQFAMRHPLTGEVTCVEGREAIVSYYGDALEGATVTDVDLVVRVVDRWFVFSETVVRLCHPDRGELLARMADVCVIGRDGSIIVHLGTSPGPAIEVVS